MKISLADGCTHYAKKNLRAAAGLSHYISWAITQEQGGIKFDPLWRFFERHRNCSHPADKSPMDDYPVSLIPENVLKAVIQTHRVECRFETTPLGKPGGFLKRGKFLFRVYSASTHGFSVDLVKTVRELAFPFYKLTPPTNQEGLPKNLQLGLPENLHLINEIEEYLYDHFDELMLNLEIENAYLSDVSLEEPEDFRESFKSFNFYPKGKGEFELHCAHKCWSNDDSFAFDEMVSVWASTGKLPTKSQAFMSVTGRKHDHSANKSFSSKVLVAVRDGVLAFP